MKNIRTLSQRFGDLRQAFDTLSNEIPDRAEWEIKWVQDAFERLAPFIPDDSCTKAKGTAA
jgi:hypothetical protein